MGPSRIGFAGFVRSVLKPAQAKEIIPQSTIDRWIPRKTQIVMIELIAPILALWTLKDYVKEKTILLFVDSEAVEGALIKGYAARSDVCMLVGVFWQLALSLKCLIYIDRIPTDSNCSDGPSRDNLQIGNSVG